MEIIKILNLTIYLTNKNDGNLNSEAKIKHFFNKFSKQVLYMSHEHQAQRFIIKKIDPNKTINTDAVISKEKESLLTMRIADCYSVVIYDPVHEVYALIHAGWQPLYRHILELTVTDLKNHYQVNPRHCQVWIGPGIKACCYKTKVEPCQKKTLAWKKFIIFDPHTQLYSVDLFNYIKGILNDLGFQSINMQIDGRCTCCSQELFYSHYRDKVENPKARFAVAVKLT